MISMDSSRLERLLAHVVRGYFPYQGERRTHSHTFMQKCKQEEHTHTYTYKHQNAGKMALNRARVVLQDTPLSMVRVGVNMDGLHIVDHEANVCVCGCVCETKERDLLF